MYRLTSLYPFYNVIVLWFDVFCYISRFLSVSLVKHLVTLVLKEIWK